MLLALLLPCHAMAQSAFNGTWKIDINKVQTSTKPQVITLKDGDYSCNCTPPIHIKADGMDHAVSGHPAMNTVAADGKTATFESTSERGGNASTVKGTLTRVGKGAAGSHAIAGAWHASSFQSASDNMLTYTCKVDGNHVSMTDPRGESYDARLDGKPVAYTGDPGTDTIAVKMVGKAMQETSSLAGKVTSVSSMTVSADGKRMTSVITNKTSNRKTTIVAMKQ